MANIKVKDLNTTSSVTSSNKIMVLTNDVSNAVNNITVENFNQSIISSDANNGLSQGADGNLYVDNADSGVTAGTYQYPQNLVVDSKGKITSVTSGSPASVPIATSSSTGIVQPDNSTITVDGNGIITATPDLSSRADVNLSNVTNTGTSSGASWSMPSSTYDDLTVGASGAQYAAPANGWFYFARTTTAVGKYIQLSSGNLTVRSYGPANGDWLGVYLPVKKNDTVTASYSQNTSADTFRFYYAVGSESEA